MAAYLYTLRAAANKPFFFSSSSSSPHSRPENNQLMSSATAARNPALAVKAKATSPAEEPSGSDGGRTRLSAWASVRRERWEGELPVEGQLPPWLNGTYLRNGPGLWDVGDRTFHHLFDGYATLVCVSFRQGHAAGAHRQIVSEAYKAARARGRPLHPEFAHCPKPPPAALLAALLAGGPAAAAAALLPDNPNSAVVPLGDGRVLCLAESARSSTLVDPATLATVGRFPYADTLGGMAVQAGHPIVDAAAGEVVTVLPDLARRGYLVVRMEVGSSERKVIGRIGCRGGGLTPGWVHSFAVTENFIVVPEMPLRYSPTRLLRSELAEFYAFDWLPASGSYMHVLSRSTGKMVASVEVPPFMAMHFINAYEEKRRDDDGQAVAVVVDCCEHYGDPATIHTLDIHSLRSLQGEDVLPDARVGRFRIPLDGSSFGELEAALDPEQHGRGMDMCTINPAFLGRSYRYAYGCGARRPCNFPNTLAKIDLLEKTAKNWHQDGVVPSEPLFVARPGTTEEDDGVVISIVSTIQGDGYALVLDGMTFQEIARVRFPYGLPYGFHGCWIPEKI
ncbi:hypothetical protein ACP4OV_006912 [Aristida adscensionis]